MKAVVRYDEEGGILVIEGEHRPRVQEEIDRVLIRDVDLAKEINERFIVQGAMLRVTVERLEAWH